MFVDYKGYRPKFMTLEHACSLLRFSTRTLNRINSGDEIPTDEVADRMAKIYAAPLLIFEHFGYNNHIGLRYFCRPLNQIERTMPAACFKTPEEVTEMIQAVQEMCKMMLNNRDLSKWGLTEQLDKCFEEVIDVEQLILELKIIYAGQRGLKALEERYREHDAKCERHGYIVDKRKAPIAVEAGAQYVISHL